MRTSHLHGPRGPVAPTHGEWRGPYAQELADARGVKDEAQDAEDRVELGI